MRIPNSEHTSRPWRIRDVVPDFSLLDVWALPAHGSVGDFQRLLDLVLASNPANAEAVLTRFLWRVRDRFGDRLGLGRISVGTDADPLGGEKATIPGTNEITLTERLPDDLRDTARDLRFTSLPFVPLYRTNLEFAAEISNRTMHGVAHLAWVHQDGDNYQGQMAVYVKPRGRFGRLYLMAIEPFRQLIVYPALMRQMARRWDAQSQGVVVELPGSRVSS